MHRLDRFDDLLNRLRKSTLEKENPFPSIHAPKPKPPSPPKQIFSPQELQELPTEQISVEPLPDPKNPPSKHTHSFSNNKSPLSTPPQPPSSVIVNLSSSSSSSSTTTTTTTTTTTNTPLDQPSASPSPEAAVATTTTTTLTSPLSSSTENSKLDWASLVEAARQSDAEEDQLPDLTEWATSPNHHNLSPSQEQPNKNIIPPTDPDTLAPPGAQLNVQSREEIVGALGRLVKIQLGGAIQSSSSAVKSTDRSEDPSTLTRPPPTTTITPPAASDADNNEYTKTSKPDSHASTASVSQRRQLLQSPLSSSSRLLNQKQKQSIARLIMPVSPVPSSSSSSASPSSSSATTTTTTTNINTNVAANLIDSSSSLTPTPVSSHSRPIHPPLVPSSKTTLPPAAGSSSSCSTGPSHLVGGSLSLNDQSSAPRKDLPVRLVDSVALRLVSGRLSSNAKSTPSSHTVDHLKARSSGPDPCTSTASDHLVGPVKLEQPLASPDVSSAHLPDSSSSVKLAKKKVMEKKLGQRSLADPSSSVLPAPATHPGVDLASNILKDSPDPPIVSSTCSSSNGMSTGVSSCIAGDGKKMRKPRREKKAKVGGGIMNGEIKNGEIKNGEIKKKVFMKEEQGQLGTANQNNLALPHHHPSHPTTTTTSVSSTSKSPPPPSHDLHLRHPARLAPRPSKNSNRPSIHLFDKLTGGGLLKS
ncbi:hypothetical protein PGTUg99_033820 [Puccinia graminis f. sp. tritici]|uniref:Uncharacterized protein n=1 Tax=Puccinia graminis f. sp. tritici TaxID=56615 RepID=A0A5B0RW40_PUCGR|nr:hypothetical protein PGTUg99_033820 [Puccinia graminis f. sp. tritici]